MDGILPQYSSQEEKRSPRDIFNSNDQQENEDHEVETFSINLYENNLMTGQNQEEHYSKSKQTNVANSQRHKGLIEREDDDEGYSLFYLNSKNQMTGSEVEATQITNFVDQKVDNPSSASDPTNMEYQPNTAGFNTVEQNVGPSFNLQEPGASYNNFGLNEEFGQRHGSSGEISSPQFAMKSGSFVGTKGGSDSDHYNGFASRNKMGSSGMTSEQSLPFELSASQVELEIQKTSPGALKTLDKSDTEFKSSEAQQMIQEESKESNWQELIKDNPFYCNQVSSDQSWNQFNEYGDCPSSNFKNEEDMTRSDKFSQRVVSLGPHQYIQKADDLFTDADKQSEGQKNGRDSSGEENENTVSLSDLVQQEHLKNHQSGKRNGNNCSEKDDSDNENHDCEDEELVIQEKVMSTKNQFNSQQNKFNKQIQEVNQKRDVVDSSRYDSLENGEVRDDSDDDEEDEYGSNYDITRPVNFHRDDDENGFFDAAQAEEDEEEESPDEKNKTIALIKKLKLFSISPKDKSEPNTQTIEKENSSVYQTPELGQFTDFSSQKRQKVNTDENEADGKTNKEDYGEVKKLNFDSKVGKAISSELNHQDEEEENVVDSDESDQDQTNPSKVQDFKNTDGPVYGDEQDFDRRAMFEEFLENNPFANKTIIDGTQNHHNQQNQVQKKNEESPYVHSSGVHRLTFGSACRSEFQNSEKSEEDALYVKDKQLSFTVIDMEEETTGQKIKQIQESTGKRKGNYCKIGESQLEQTFGDSDGINYPAQVVQNQFQDAAFRNLSNDISLSTDSIFNLHEEEMKSEDGVSPDKKSKKTKSSVGTKSQEYEQLSTWMSRIEEVWAKIKMDYSEFLKKDINENIYKKPFRYQQHQSRDDKIPVELTSELEQLITQVSVFYQLNKSKPSLKIPTKKGSFLASLAKQIVIQDRINIPRQTRAQFTITVLEMLKHIQENVQLRSKKQLEQKKQIKISHSTKTLDSNKTSDFNSLSSSFMKQQQELVQDLASRHEALKTPPTAQTSIKPPTILSSSASSQNKRHKHQKADVETRVEQNPLGRSKSHQKLQQNSNPKLLFPPSSSSLKQLDQSEKQLVAATGQKQSKFSGKSVCRQTHAGDFATGEESNLKLHASSSRSAQPVSKVLPPPSSPSLAIQQQSRKGNGVQTNSVVQQNNGEPDNHVQFSSAMQRQGESVPSLTQVPSQKRWEVASQQTEKSMIESDVDLKSKMKMLKKGFIGSCSGRFGAAGAHGGRSVPGDTAASVTSNGSGMGGVQSARNPRSYQLQNNKAAVENENSLLKSIDFGIGAESHKQKEQTQSRQQLDQVEDKVLGFKGMRGQFDGVEFSHEDFIHQSMQLSSVGDNNSICSSRKSLGFGVQSMDGRRQRGKRVVSKNKIKTQNSKVKIKPAKSKQKSSKQTKPPLTSMAEELDDPFNINSNKIGMSPIEKFVMLNSQKDTNKSAPIRSVQTKMNNQNSSNNLLKKHKQLQESSQINLGIQQISIAPSQKVQNSINSAIPYNVSRVSGVSQGQQMTQNKNQQEEEDDDTWI